MNSIDESILEAQAEETNARRRIRHRVWKTKDGRAIPYGKLTDGHLLNLLKFLRRNAVLLAAAQTARMVLQSPIAESMGDAAQMAFDGELRDTMDAPWVESANPAMVGLVQEAASREQTKESANEIMSCDMIMERIGLELQLMKSPSATA